MGAPIPSVTVKSLLGDVAFLADTAPGSFYTVDYVIAAGYGPLKPGDIIGLITGGLGAPQKRTAITTAIPTITSSRVFNVSQPAAFIPGSVVDFVDGTDDSTELFSDKVVESFDCAAGTITLTAALTSGALDTTDWIRLKTVDGAEAGIGICMGNMPAPTTGSVTTQSQTVPVLIAGRVKKALVPQLNAALYNLATELKATDLAAGVTSIGV